jgi:hypothetical protein
MNNLINEEIESIKYLFGYKKGKVISEQQTTVTPTAATAPELITKIQSILKTKYGANLGTSGPNRDGIDGKWGPKTQSAFESTSKLTKPVVAPAAAPTTVAPVAAPVAAPTTAAPAAAPTTAAPVAAPTTAAPKSNRDQRRERQDLRRINKRAMQDLRAQQRTQQ